MHWFYVENSQIEEDRIKICGADVNHIKNVLRMKVGERLHISDGNNQTYLCEIMDIEPEKVTASIIEVLEKDTELPSRIYLFQGLPKSDKMELIVQKAVELGVYEIIPVATKRAVVKLDDKKALKKVERWSSISESAAKQSGRVCVPSVHEVLSYKEALCYAEQLDVVLIPYELAEGLDATREIVSSILPGQSVGIFIGPEGGFEVAEIEAAVAKGVKPITLGKRILRTETAGLTMLSILMYHLEKK